MKQIKSSNLRKASFQDAFFVRMKIQNSILMPKYPPKNPKYQQIHASQYIHKIFLPFIDPKPQSFIERIRKSQTKPSQHQVNEWIAKKQAQLNQAIQSQNRTCDLIKLPSSEQKILLRTPSQVEELNRIAKLKSLNSFSNRHQNQLLKRSSLQRSSVSRSQVGNLNHSTCYEPSPEGHTKLNEKITVFPVLLKLKQQNKAMAILNESNSSIGKQLKVNKSVHSLKPKPRAVDKDSNLRLSQQQSSKSLLTLKQTQQHQTSNQTELKRTKSFIQKKTSISQSVRTFGNPLYEHKAKAPEPLIKYSQRQLSPNVQKDLAKKYSQLQNRLNNILKQVRCSKKSNTC